MQRYGNTLVSSQSKPMTPLTSTVDKMFTLDFSSVGKDSTYLAISAKNFLYLDFFNYLDTYKG
jgi:hypothetical protein